VSATGNTCVDYVIHVLEADLHPLPVETHCIKYSACSGARPIRRDLKKKVWVGLLTDY
jgi:hypothetical protein